jgi:hypothetical protein
MNTDREIRKNLENLQQLQSATLHNENEQMWRVNMYDWPTKFDSTLKDWGVWNNTEKNMTVTIDPDTGIWYHTGGNWYTAMFNPDREDHTAPGLLHQINEDGDHWYPHNHNPHTITMGCSVSAGTGLPHNYTWAYVHQHHTGNTTNNISTPGQNIWYNVHKFFKHVEKYGNPQQILMLVPPLDRFTGPHERNVNNTYVTKTIHYNKDLETYTQTGKTTKHRNTSLNGAKTTPHREQAIWQNITALNLLQAYANTHGITLKISAWENETLHALWLLKTPSLQTPRPKHLAPAENEQSIEYPRIMGQFKYPGITENLGHPTHCPCDLEPQTDHQHIVWDHAANKHWKHPNPHPGLHQQIHYYEIITGNKIENSDLTTLHPFWHGTNITPPK